MLNSTYQIGTETYYKLVDPGIIDTEEQQHEPFVEPLFVDASSNMNMVKPIFNDSKNDMDMIRPYFDEHKNDMHMVEPLFDEHKNDMEMVVPVYDEHKNKMDMVRPIYDEHKNKMDMVMTYTSTYGSTIVPYVNTGLTESGQHITQVKTLLTREFNKFFKGSLGRIPA